MNPDNLIMDALFAAALYAEIAAVVQEDASGMTAQFIVGEVVQNAAAYTYDQTYVVPRIHEAAEEAAEWLWALTLAGMVGNQKNEERARPEWIHPVDL